MSARPGRSKRDANVASRLLRLTLISPLPLFPPRSGARERREEAEQDDGRPGLGDEEDVGLEVGEVGVSHDDVREAGAAEQVEFGGGEIGVAFVPEAVAVAEAFELDAQ